MGNRRTREDEETRAYLLIEFGTRRGGIVFPLEKTHGRLDLCVCVRAARRTVPLTHLGVCGLPEPSWYESNFQFTRVSVLGLMFASEQIPVQNKERNGDSSSYDGNK